MDKKKQIIVSHTLRVENATRYESTSIYRPDNIITPVHTFERNHPVNIISEREAAVQSLLFGYTYAFQNREKWGADSIELKSSVKGVAEEVRAGVGENA